ncbi:hypothetical protein ACXU4B_07950 [Dyella soli]|uniref:hypothetical protein n=1 Tax=Dyella soli TaxID=522319 RepID=UPI0013F43FE2|nr:hypothetical protein [Dyella soli]
MRVARYFGVLKPELAPVPLTHRQVLLAAQDKCKAEDRARRLELVRQVRAGSRVRP